jgi:hypothetical protein
MVRAWHVAGQPTPQKAIPALAEFSTWAEIVGGILSFAGVDGFLDNLAQLYDETDVEGPQWTGFLEMWLLTLGKNDYTAAAIIEAIKKEKDLEAALPEPLSGLPLGDDKEVRAFSIRLGRALRKRKGTPYGRNNVRLDMKEDKHSKQKLWSVTDRPVTLAKPTRLDWSQQRILPSETEEQHVQASSKEEHQALANRHLSGKCQVLHCDRKREGDDGFVCDTYGHAWCHQHVNRKRILEQGGSLLHPFPTLFYMRGSQMLQDGRSSWEEFVRTAPNEAIAEILKSIESHQARELLLKPSAEHDTT